MNQLQPSDAEKWLAEFNKDPELLVQHLKQRFDAAAIVKQLTKYASDHQQTLNLSQLRSNEDHLQMALWGCAVPENMDHLVRHVHWPELQWGSADLRFCQDQLTPVLKRYMQEIPQYQTRKLDDIFKSVPAKVLEQLFFKRQYFNAAGSSNNTNSHSLLTWSRIVL